MNRIVSVVVGLLILFMIASSTLFVVDQRQFAVVYSLGEIKEVITEPGLKFKLPPPLQNVVFLDRRVQTLDAADPRPIFTAEKKSLVIDWLVKWRIVDSRQYIRNSGTQLRNLETRLSPIVQAALNEEVTKRTVRAVLATEREKVMQDVRKRLEEEAKKTPAERKLPEFGSDKDFQLAQALNRLKGQPVLVSKTMTERQEEKKDN